MNSWFSGRNKVGVPFFFYLEKQRRASLWQSLIILQGGGEELGEITFRVWETEISQNMMVTTSVVWSDFKLGTFLLWSVGSC